jgi:hypothetical protein
MAQNCYIGLPRKREKIIPTNRFTFHELLHRLPFLPMG